MSKAIDIQVGGSYYKNLEIQPYEFFMVNKVPHHKAAIIRRIIRYDQCGRDPAEDLNKILHECALIMELSKEIGYYSRIFLNDKILIDKFILKNKFKGIKLNVIKLVYEYDTIAGKGFADILKIQEIVKKELEKYNE